MGDFFPRRSPQAPPGSQLLNPNQGLRMLHAPPLLPNGKGKKSAPPPILREAPRKLHLPNRHSRDRRQCTEDELTVSNLRQLYSSLLEELAPLHHEIGTGGSDDNYRWKNAGTVTVHGSDDEGYDYAFTPDTSQKSWRLQTSAPGGTGPGGGGITGGDWARDGIRRYHTGGALAAERGGGGHSSHVIRVGGIDVDVGTMNGVEISPAKARQGEGEAGEGRIDYNFSIDDEDDDADPGGGSVDANDDVGQEDVFQDVDIAGAGSPVDDGPPPTSAVSKGNDGNISFNPPNDNEKANMTTFESMYHLSPAMAWRLRSAYAPKTPQEQHLHSLGSEVLAQRHPKKADGIMKGLDVARNCESRVCDGLRKIGELISYCERLKGVKFAADRKRADNEEGGSSGEDEDDLESAEAIFAYFCEKNVLPMLIDALLCHPPPLTSPPTDGSDADNMVLPSATTTIGSSPSIFSGVAWTSAVKSQILQTIAMILFNTSSPLSLTYLLSNNYMNELIMGILPMDQWKENALEEILPPYITLCRGLVMRLRGEGSSCLPLFLCQRPRRRNEASADKDPSTETYLPLLFAATQVFCSPFGTSLRDSEGCLVRTTAMNVILNLCRISDPVVQDVLVQGGRDALKETLPTTKSTPPQAPSPSLLPHPLTTEQELLFPHICKSLISWFHRSVRLAMASLSIDNRQQDEAIHHEAKAEAKARHKDMAEMQFRELQYWLGFVDDLLSCEIRAWNARLVEWFLREVVVGTVLLRWNRSLEVMGGHVDYGTKASSEILKARAETRVSIIFLTQLFGMVEYSPLIRLVATLVLHHQYPSEWYRLENGADFGKGDGLFVVTPTTNALVSKNPHVAGEPVAVTSAEEADAGAGGLTNSVSSVAETSQGQSGANEGPEKRTSLSDGDSEMDHRASETVANRQRAAMLEILSGNASREEVLLVSMLLATILESDAMDDTALEVLSVLPSSTVFDEGNSIQMSPFEASIAQNLSGIDGSDAQSYAALECVSSLGLMLLERLIGHTWTEGGQCVDAVPFDHFFTSSKFIRASGASLSQFASQAESHLDETNVVHDIFSDLIRKRYSPANDADAGSPRSQDQSVQMFSSLQNYYPSNFIDDTGVLVEVQYGGACHDSPTTGDLFLSNEEHEAARFAIQSVLHLRSLVGCIQDLHKRVTGSGSSTDLSHWHGEGDLLSFRTTEEADDILLALGGIQTTSLPEVGTDIDLRGRRFFDCSLPRKFKFGRNVEYDIIIDANGTRFVVTEKANLVLVVDPSEMYIAKPKRRDVNRCTVLAVVPHRTVVASGAEGDLIHMVISTEYDGPRSEFIRNGTLSLKFQNTEHCQLMKECLDGHIAAHENRTTMDMTDLLERCKTMGDEASRSDPQGNEVEADAWCDFQG